jgi:hypothetical protein
MLSALALLSAVSSAAPLTWDEEMSSISRDYDAVSDAEQGEAQVKVSKEFLARATELQKRFPDRGLPLAWMGWMRVSAAVNMTDPAAMLPLLLDGRGNLIAAVEKEPNCCDADPYVTLALLYQIPITGKDESATVRMYFDKGFAINPNSLALNARYAGYLMKSGDLEGALKYANIALAAPPLSNHREKQDKATRQIAQDFLEQTNDRIKRRDAANAPK